MRILILVGPKGCGKTTIGQWIADHWSNDCSFLEVEVIAKRVLEARGGVMDKGYPKACFDAIRDAIEAQVDACDKKFLVFETTGAAPETQAFLDDLRERHVLLLVRIRASALTCTDRIQNRDSTRQVPVSRELVERMHAATEALDWSWDLELENDDEKRLSREEVVKEVQNILAKCVD